ncbi:hypothetical protein BKA70DRAFT_1225432 [Coprinopsis sp. MPI-PUGE-AT-0042]|nr:hypothetical protein BKA70DRAFT_1225432 [Coprinopsis sp. MPI-PUGE-AT-0042]
MIKAKASENSGDWDKGRTKSSTEKQLRTYKSIIQSKVLVRQYACIRVDIHVGYKALRPCWIPPSIGCCTDPTNDERTLSRTPNERSSTYLCLWSRFVVSSSFVVGFVVGYDGSRLIILSVGEEPESVQPVLFASAASLFRGLASKIAISQAEDRRDASWVRYDLQVDKYAHQRNREPVFEWKSFYGQLEYLYLVELPPSSTFPFLSPNTPTRIALAMVRQTNITRRNV